MDGQLWPNALVQNMPVAPVNAIAIAIKNVAAKITYD